MKSKPLLLMVVAWSGLLTAADPALAQTWTLTSAPLTNWVSVASSADGTKLVAVVNGGGIYTSTNSGSTWQLTSAPNSNWTLVVCSADGAKLAAPNGFQMYISTNSGAAWAPAVGGFGGLSTMCSSSDASLLVGVSCIGPIQGSIFTSTNFGTTWSMNSAQSTCYRAVACSASGQTIVTVGQVYKSYGVFISTNSGASWRPGPITGPGLLASSATGARLVMASDTDGSGGGGAVFVSTNTGADWIPTSAPISSWTSVASSADGGRLAAATGGYSVPGTIYLTSDFGLTWDSNSAPITNWSSVASSSDGCKLVAVVNGGGIYTWHTTPHPVLNATPSGTSLVLSWIIPSQPFVLQESGDLNSANWTDVTNVPILNLTNLENQVTLPLATGNRFYRLKASAN